MSQEDVGPLTAAEWEAVGVWRSQPAYVDVDSIYRAMVHVDDVREILEDSDQELDDSDRNVMARKLVVALDAIRGRTDQIAMAYAIAGIERSHVRMIAAMVVTELAKGPT